MRVQGKDGHLQAKETGSQRNNLKNNMILLRLQGLRTEKPISVISSVQPVVFCYCGSCRLIHVSEGKKIIL